MTSVRPVIRIDFEPPRHGWIEARLRLDDVVVWADDASYLEDCVAGLAEAALLLAERRPVREVAFWREPSASVWRFTGDGDTIRLAITDVRELGDGHGDLVLEVDLARDALIRAIWTALRRIEGAIGADRFAEGWRPGFPTRAVAALGDHVQVEP